MVKQSLPLLILCGIGAIFAGSTLGAMTEVLQNIPGLIVVIPGIIALRGTISTTFGSRLGSAYHLGIIDADNMWNEDLKQNILGSLILSVFVSLTIGILAYATSLLFHVQPDPLKLILIVLIAGCLSALILMFLTVGITYQIFKRGYDPDNITGPALATFGDIITMLCIFGSAVVVEAMV